MNSPLAPAWLIAGNLAGFSLFAAYFLSPGTEISHHWIFVLLEGLFLAQGEVLRNPRLLKTLTFISIAVLVVSLLRIETIYLSRHLIHFGLAWTAGGIVHLRLRIALREDFYFRRLNAVLALACTIGAGLSSILAFDQGIWWGIGAGE